MHPSRRSTLSLLLPAAGAGVLALAVLLLLFPAAEPVRVLLPTGLALMLLAAALGLNRAGAGDREALQNRLATQERDASQLRHDLRGILSPAMLTADRLTASADPTVRKAGETMVATVERAEQRLRAAAARPET